MARPVGAGEPSCGHGPSALFWRFPAGLSPQLGSDFVGGVNPYAQAAVPTGLLFGTGATLISAALVASVVALVLRLRRARGVERDQLKWVALGAAAVGVVLPMSAALWTVWTPIQLLAAIALVLLPISACVAILRHRLYDVDLVIARTVAYAVIAVLLATVYATVTLTAARFVYAQLRAEPALGAAIDEAVAELAASIDELRELAGGLRPGSLDNGLDSALRELAARTPVRLDLRAQGVRFPTHVEMAAYFVACEAVANAVKHADASQISLTLDQQDGSLIVTVVDDGRGGAQPHRGTGLLGLADRVRAHHGHLHVDSPLGGGTRLEARMPCE